MANPREHPSEVRRKRRARTPEGIPFATIEKLIAKLHGLDSNAETALRSRLHALRRLDFPDGVAAGSGRHFAYGASDVIGLAFAFELIEAFVPPSAAVEIVRAGWPEIALAAVDGRKTDADPERVVIHPRALGASLGPASGTGRLPHVDLETRIGTPAGGPTISVDAGSLVRRTLGELAAIDRRSSAIMESELDLVAARFGRGRPLERGNAVQGRLGGDGPYWPRAAALINGATAGDLQANKPQLRWLLDYLLKPAPVDAWKTRVEVAPDVGFAAAIAWWSKGSNLTASRTSFPADGLERVGHRLVSAGIPKDELVTRLMAIVEKASNLAEVEGVSEMAR